MMFLKTRHPFNRFAMRCFDALVGSLLTLSLLAPWAEAVQLGSAIEMFVDRRMVGASESVELKLHPPKAREVVLQLDQQYEGPASTYFTVLRDAQNRVRLYYRGYVDGLGSRELTLMATSQDGIHFDRPNLGIYEHNGSTANHIVWEGEPAHTSHNMAPFLDSNPNAPADAKWKALGGEGKLYALKSPDGIHWKVMQPEQLQLAGEFDSQNTAFWDEEAGLYRSFSRYWQGGMRPGGVRAIQMSTSTDFINWTPPQHFQYDVPLHHFYTNGIVKLDEAGGVFIGFPMVLDESRTNMPSPDQNGVSYAVLISSRDGVRWNREPSDPWIEEGVDTTRSRMPAWGMLETAPDEWSIYATERYFLKENRLRRYTMKPYRFASVHAGGTTGWFETPAITFDGKRLLLNFATEPGGEIAVEIRDKDGKPIQGFAMSDMTPVSGDALNQHVTWNSGRTVDELIGAEVRLYFRLTKADMFAFQFAPMPLSTGDLNSESFVGNAKCVARRDSIENRKSGAGLNR